MYAAEYHAQDLLLGAMSRTGEAWPFPDVGTGFDGGMDEMDQTTGLPLCSQRPQPKRNVRGFLSKMRAKFQRTTGESLTFTYGTPLKITHDHMHIRIASKKRNGFTRQNAH